MAGRFSIEAVFRAVDRVTAPVTRMQNRVGKFTRSADRGFRRLNRTVNKFGRGIKRGAQVAVVAVGLLGTAMAATLGPGANFEQAIVNVGAVSLKTRDQIKELEVQALQLGRTTKFTATQSANAMEVLAKAGFTVNDILEATPAVLSAAAASGLEIAEVANVVSNVLKGMGLETSEAARVSDVLALASARTNSTIGSLGESMKNVAATARKLNIPLEEVVAGVALLQDVGLDASVAGSAFNVMLTKMAAPSSKITKIMRRLNLSFKDANGNMKALPDVIADINVASKAMGGNFDQVAFLAELVGLRGQKAASNLGDLFESGKAQTLTAELRKATGVADQMAAIRMDTVQGSMLLLGSAIDAVQVKIFGLNKGPLNDVIKNMTKWVGANEDLIATKVGEFIKSTVSGLVKFVKFIAENGDTILTVSKGLLGLVVVLKAVSAALAIMTIAATANPFGIMVASVVALVAGVTALISLFGEFNEASEKAQPGRGRGVIGDDDDEGATAGTSRRRQRGRTGVQIISPADRVARSIDEQRTTTETEVTIRDETGRAEVTGGKLRRGVSLQATGGF